MAYQKEQEDLTALLFLIEHTHTGLYMCMAFLKIEPFACVPMGRFGEKGEPKLLQDVFWGGCRSWGRKGERRHSR